MLVHLRRAGAVALLAAGGALISSACVNNESSLFVRECLAVPRDTCLATPTTNAAFYSSGSVDAAYRGSYVCAAMIENQMVEVGSATQLRTETSRISVYEAEVQVLTNDPNSPQTIAEYTVPVSSFVDPGNGTDPGLSVAFVTLLDNATMQKVAKQAGGRGTYQVVTSTVLHGRTLGGIELQSNTFKFPIDVAVGGSCQAAPGMPCASSGMASSSLPTDCELGQDEPVDCRYLDPCTYLVCDKDSTGTGILNSARCPPNGGLGDGSCCGAM